MIHLVSELDTAAGIARVLRARRAELGWVKRRVREAERLAASLSRWQGRRGAADFGRRPAA